MISLAAIASLVGVLTTGLARGSVRPTAATAHEGNLCCDRMFKRVMTAGGFFWGS
jgi:hypothetical protein